jgi:hypothetical protein
MTRYEQLTKKIDDLREAASRCPAMAPVWIAKARILVVTRELLTIEQAEAKV